MVAVTGGLAATAGLLVGVGIAQQLKITELPEMVAAFHSLVRRCNRSVCRKCFKLITLKRENRSGERAIALETIFVRLMWRCAVSGANAW